MGNTQTITYSVPTDKIDQEGETCIFRCKLLKPEEGLLSTYKGFSEFKSLLYSVFKEHKNRPLFGTREKVEEEVYNEETNTTEIEVTYGKYLYMTYGQVQEFAE